MSFELTCKIIAGVASASSFVFVTLNIPGLAVTVPASLTGGLLTGAGGFKYSESICNLPAKKVCHEVYENFDGPSSGWAEYIASRTAGLPGHMAEVKAQCIEEGRYYPTTPTNPT